VKSAVLAGTLVIAMLVALVSAVARTDHARRRAETTARQVG
jgi:hypothetical protein